MRNEKLLNILIKKNKKVLFTGPTGTGKSKIIYKTLFNGLDKTKFDFICLTFSAQTSEVQCQETIENKLIKRTKTMRGPPLGKECVVFIDDLNMPEKEIFGAQPPIELLRQYSSEMCLNLMQQ